MVVVVLYCQNQRIPADLILLRTTDKSGSCFIRTDQLDGETDWKLRLPITALQKLSHDEDVFQVDAVISAEPPKQDIHSFLGTFTLVRDILDNSNHILRTRRQINL